MGFRHDVGQAQKQLYRNPHSPAGSAQKASNGRAAGAGNRGLQ